jgi:hypothetical protein
MATTRERLHELLDELPEDRLADAETAITALASPPYRPPSEAPEDDEPVTDEDLEAIREGREEYRHGETIAGDVIRREFGF